MPHDVFVSYSSKDKAVADTIVASFEKNGVRCWYAPRDIKPGEDWGTAITNAIDSCCVFLMIFSQHANHSQRVLDELNFAVSQEKIILPFRIENFSPKGAMMLHLSSRHWLDAYDPSWESYIRKLIQTVSANLDTSLVEEEIKLPDHGQKKEIRHKKKWIIKTTIWAIVGFAVIGGAWFGISSLLSLAQNAEGIDEVQLVQSEEIPSTQEIIETEEITLVQETVTTEIIENNSCKIIFYSGRNGDQEVFVMDPDGNNQTQMTFNQDLDIRAEISPDETEIVFMSARDGDGEIFIMNADGSNIRNLTNNDWVDQNPRWSPDGNQIGFFSNRGGGWDLYVMNKDGSDQKKITKQNFPSTDSWPTLSWSSDGLTIAFNSDADGDYEIYTINVDGSNLMKLTDNDKFDISPDISPDMSQVVFVSDRYGDSEIFAMDLNGANIRQLTSANGVSWDPRFSPMGSKIIFTSDRALNSGSGESFAENIEVYIMDLDGSNVVRLTDNNFFEGDVKFTPSCDF